LNKFIVALIVFALSCFLTELVQAATLGYQLTNTLAPGSERKPHIEAVRPNIPIKTFTIGKGETITIPVMDLKRHMILDPKVAAILSRTDIDIMVQGDTVGATVILLWTEAGVRSVRIVVTIPKSEIEAQKKVELERSKSYRSKRERSFKFAYSLTHSLLRKNGVPPHVKEAKKLWDHQLTTTGATPLGKLKGKLQWERRKSDSLQDTVTMIRDFQLGLFNTEPRLSWFQGYDMIGGAHFLRQNDFAFPGTRYEGLTIVPSKSRLEEAKRFSMHPFFFIGQERSGSFVDSPSGIKDRKLKDEMLGTGLDFYVWDNAAIKYGFYQRWSGPKSGQGDRGHNITLDFDLPGVHLDGELGIDELDQVAGQVNAKVEKDWFVTEHKWLNVHKRFNTITGAGGGRGNLGYQGRVEISPFEPYFGNDSIQIGLNTSIMKNRLSRNPDRQKQYTSVSSGFFNWHISRTMNLASLFYFDDRRASPSPLLQRGISARLDQNILFKSPWVKSVRLFGSTALDSYRKSVNSPGQNATRYHVGVGTTAQLFWGSVVSAKYLWYRLVEKEVETPPKDRTYPSQLTLEARWSRPIWELPATLDLGFRYVDERETFAAPRQSFTNQDHYGADALLNVRLSQDTTFFIQANALANKSIVGLPREAEFSLLSGLRLNWDSPIVIPRKGRITGYFFQDLNGNGVRDLGEPGIAGKTIMVKGGKNTRTDKKGYYSLSVPEGFIAVEASRDIPEGYFFSTASQKKVEFLKGEDYEINFGITSQVYVRGRAYLDVNENSFFDEGDIGMSGVRFIVDSGQTGLAVGSGLYSILKVLSGSNRIQVDLDSILPGFVTRSPIEKRFEGSSGDVVIFDVIFGAERHVGGYVFNDANGDGGLGLDEVGLEDVIVTLNGHKAVTNHNGRYFIRKLKPGTYTAKIDLNSLPEHYQPTVLEHKIEVPARPLMRQDVHFPVIKRSNE
jgi:hypothetical protein